MKTSSKEYWEKRWAENPDAPSWDDKGAVELENRFIQDHLPTEGPYLELGCGKGDLLRIPGVSEKILSSYVGIDACVEEYTRTMEFRSPSFIREDLTRARPEWFRGVQTVISKRTLQNLSPVARRPLLELVAQVPHGLLIEDFLPARANLDRVRRSMGLPPLEIPEFNWSLFESERRRLPPQTKCHAFLGRYYSITRTIPECESRIRLWALRIANYERHRGLTPPPYGPVVAFVW